MLIGDIESRRESTLSFAAETPTHPHDWSHWKLAVPKVESIHRQATEMFRCCPEPGGWDNRSDLDIKMQPFSET
jgi:hypothetical protein